MWLPLVPRTCGTLVLGPDGRWLAWSTGAFAEIGVGATVLFDAHRLVPAVVLPAGGPAAFAPNSKELAIALGTRGGGIAIFDLESFDRVATVAPELAAVVDRHHDKGLAYAPDGETLAIGTGGLGPFDTGTVELWWRSAAGHWARSASTTTDLGVVELEFSPGGKELLAGCSGDGPNGYVLMLDPETLAVRDELRGLRCCFRDLEFMPGGQRVVCASHASIHVWDRSRRREIEGLRILPHAMSSPVAIDPEGRYLAVGARTGVTLWHIETGLETLSIPSDIVYSLVFTVDGTLVGSAGGRLSCWPALSSEGELERRIAAGGKRVLQPGLLPKAAWAAEALASNRPFESVGDPRDRLREALARGRAAALLDRPEAVPAFDRIERFRDEPQRWRIAGPFPGGSDVSASLDLVHSPEEGDDLLAAGGVARRMITVSAEDDRDRRVDSRKHLENEASDGVVAYALGIARAGHAASATLLVGSDDGIKVWLNGEVVHTKAVVRELQPGHDAISIALREGENTFLVKVANFEGPWGFSISVVDERGMPVDLVWSD